jgi:hypothetical protein
MRMRTASEQFHGALVDRSHSIVAGQDLEANNHQHTAEQKTRCGTREPWSAIYIHDILMNQATA